MNAGPPALAARAAASPLRRERAAGLPNRGNAAASGAAATGGTVARAANAANAADVPVDAAGPARGNAARVRRPTANQPSPPPAKQPPAATGDGSPGDPNGDLLASVSRSFSLTIRLLPEPLREPITVGYLLARAQDTVADTPNVPAATRLEHLRALLEMVRYGADAEVLPTLQRALAAKQKHDGERDLIKQLGGCLARLEALPADDRWELRRTLARIGYAQELDLLRFGEGTSAEPKTLASAAELDEYTYLIAGCVGELWTRLCQRHLPAGWSKLGEADMLKLGKRFGQGLQMVNILRDLPEDLANGRCYLPADLLTEHGLTAATSQSSPHGRGRCWTRSACRRSSIWTPAGATCWR